jgi:hypothetical protein
LLPASGAPSKRMAPVVDCILGAGGVGCLSAVLYFHKPLACCSTTGNHVQKAQHQQNNTDVH